MRRSVASFLLFHFYFFYSETAEVERRRPAETHRGAGDLFEVLCVFRYDQYFLSSRRSQKYEENIEIGFACETSNFVHDNAHNTFLHTYSCLSVSCFHFLLRAKNFKSCIVWPYICQSVCWSVCLCSSELVRQLDILVPLKRFLQHCPIKLQQLNLYLPGSYSIQHPYRKFGAKEKATEQRERNKAASDICSNDRICWPAFCDDYSQTTPRLGEPDWPKWDMMDTFELCTHTRFSFYKNTVYKNISLRFG